jgi:Methylase of polypeptide chain release factors
MMAMPAQLMAGLVDPQADRKLKILDIAAGHGLYGLAFAAKNPQAEITALDWSAVLEVAKENAAKAGSLIGTRRLKAVHSMSTLVPAMI